MNEKNRVKIKVLEIKRRYSYWQVSGRRKNMLTFAKLGFTSSVILEEIYRKLEWKDYISGPEVDNHKPPIQGEVWKFGKTIAGVTCYLKFQDRPDGVIFWISIHEAQFPLDYPFK